MISLRLRDANSAGVLARGVSAAASPHAHTDVWTAVPSGKPSCCPAGKGTGKSSQNTS